MAADLAAVLDSPDLVPLPRRPTTFEEFVERIGADEHAGGWGRSWEGECPVHGARRALHILPNEDGTAEAYCVAGCDPDAILGTLAIPTDPDYFRDASPGRFVLRHSIAGFADHLSANRFQARAVGRAALANLPKPEPLIAETLDRNTLALLAGRHGSGKSFVALGWAASVATGVSWLDRTTRPGRVLYVVGEGAFGIHQRLAAWEDRNGQTIPDDRFVLMPEAVQIANPDTRAEFIAYLDAERFDLVVIDTLARSAVGLDENSARDMGEFIHAAEEIKRATAGTVLLVHHTGKDGRTIRGSSALEAAMDTVYKVEGDAEWFTLDRDKRKDGPCEDFHTLRLEPVEESCVVVPALRSESEPEDKRPRLAEAIRLIRWAHGTTAESRTTLVATLRDPVGGVEPFSRTRAYAMLTDLEALDLVENIGTNKVAKLRLVPERVLEAGFPWPDGPSELPGMPWRPGVPVRVCSDRDGL